MSELILVEVLMFVEIVFGGNVSAVKLLLLSKRALLVTWLMYGMASSFGG